MASLVEREPVPSTHSNDAQLASFFRRFVAAPQSALLLDFDGTLAPFRVDPATVRPWAGVRELLEQILSQTRTRVAIVSGRPARQVADQLGLAKPIEIWGLHGAERLLPSDLVEHQILPPELVEALTGARQAIDLSGMALRLEEKWNAVVVHWRGLSRGASELAKAHALDALTPFAALPGMDLLVFDGGVELRAGRNKGDAVRLLLQSLPPDAPAAYLGDDTTDEDAFEALGEGGLGILVRRTWRPTAAKVWLRPPAELRAFLQRWLLALR